MQLLWLAPGLSASRGRKEAWGGPRCGDVGAPQAPLCLQDLLLLLPQTFVFNDVCYKAVLLLCFSPSAASFQSNYCLVDGSLNLSDGFHLTPDFEVRLSQPYPALSGKFLHFIFSCWSCLDFSEVSVLSPK